jgi:hypothetical protein
LLILIFQQVPLVPIVELVRVASPTYGFESAVIGQPW